MNQVFIDSNLWLYLHLRDQDIAKQRKLVPRIKAIERRCISTQVVAEVSANLLKKGGIAEAKLRSILDNLQESCSIVPTGMSAARLASDLREADTLSFWDSLIIATALEAGCNELWSEDLQHGRRVRDQLLIVNPLEGE